ncbi:MAG: HD domain-containing phosphohydrolase [Sedimenticola sp.]
MYDDLKSTPSDIMVVDDAVDNLKLLTDVLTSHGYQVRAVSNGKDALETVNLRKPDLILLDIKMPGMDGFEVCRRLKADGNTREVPVIFITASTDPKGASKGLQLGAVDYIMKPFVIDEVLARTKTHIELYRMRRHLARESEESKARFRRLVEGLKEEYFFYAHGVDGVFNYLSPSVEEVLGYTPEEFMTHYADYFTDNEINQKGAAHSEASMRGEHQPSYEVEVYRKDRKRCWLEVKETPLFDSSGKVMAVEGIAHDITARKTANELLIASQRRLEQAQHMGRMGNWELDLETKELFWSKEIYRIFGVDPDKFTPSYESFMDIVHPDDRQIVDQAYTWSVNKGVHYDIIHRINRKSDGQVCYLHEHSEQVTNTQGEVVQSVGTVQDITYKTRAEEAYREAQQKLQDALNQTVQAITNTLEQRDPYTAGHQQRVAKLAVAIGKELRLDDEVIKGLRFGGIIHDIGKIHIPAEVLNRPGKLSDDEFRIINTHPEVGFNIIKDVDFPWPVAKIIHQHHERLDGSGYPKGLQGEAICFEARILAVADVVEAISSHRPYRPALGIDVALEEITNNRGILYDSEAVDACLHLFHENLFSW